MAEIGRNLARLAEEAFERRGDYEALWFEGRWHSSGQLHERATRLAGGLRELGVQPGDRVVVMMPNCPEVGIAYNAIWRAGAVVTPAIFLLAPEELRRLLADSEATTVLTSPEFAPTVSEAAAGLEIVKRVVESVAGLEEADPADIVPRRSSDLAALLYTGGTTGRAKGVMLSHENLWFAGKAGYDAGHVPGLSRGLVSLPLSHAYGLLVTAVGPHSEERPVTVLLRWFNAESFLALIGEHRVQITAVVPSMLQALIAMPLEDYELSSLRYVVCGAAPLPGDVLDEFKRRVPHVELREGYGLTETSGIVSSNPPGRVKRGSVGLPVPGAEVRILDEGGHELPAGETGEICCRSPFVMQGYWHARDVTAETVVDGWLRTGDMGYLDDEGYLFVVDRKKDLIVRGGFNVFPRDVEDALLEHPAVAAAGVVGRPDRVHGEEVVAVVSLRPGAETQPDEILAFAKERLGGYKYPREVRVVATLPLTPIGKVDRKALRQEVVAS